MPVPELYRHFEKHPRVRRKSYPDNDTILLQGDKDGDIVIIQSGYALSYIENAQLKSVGFRLAGPSWILGTEILAGRDDYENSVKAIVYCEALRIPKSDFMEALRDLEFARPALEQMSRQQRTSDDCTLARSSFNSPRRIASILKQISDQMGDEFGASRFTQPSLARVVGLTREKTNIAVGRLIRAGVLETAKNHTIGIRNPDHLEQVASGKIKIKCLKQP